MTNIHISLSASQEIFDLPFRLRGQANNTRIQPGYVYRKLQVVWLDRRMRQSQWPGPGRSTPEMQLLIIANNYTTMYECQLISAAYM
jgi:hypothetical protein